MSKRSYITRYHLIIQKLKIKPYSSYQELSSYINSKLDYLQMQDESLSMGFSKRTMQRDIKEIRSLYGLDIEYSKANKGYFIASSEILSTNFQRMMESFDLFNALNITESFMPFVHLEKRKPQGTENFYGLLHAIKNKLRIKFSYQKFWKETVSERLAEPYLLKEFRNRWYLIARDVWDGNIKTYALDRLVEVDITNKKFEQPVPGNLEGKYRYAFGITALEGEQPQNIVLSFNAFQGKYIKTLPLHETQQTLQDNEEELRIQLKLFITHEFIMELLSYGDNVKVLQPKSLVTQMKQAYENALSLY